MEIVKLKKRNHDEEIVRQLRALMASGKLKPGDKLPSTKQLCEKFGVGRSTMREALSALKAMGYIEIRQGGGCRVLDVSERADFVPPELASLRMNRETLLHLLEARRTLEVANAQIAAAKRSEADLAELAQIVSAMEQATEDAEGERLDIEFHTALVKMTHNPILQQMFDSIVGQLSNAIRNIRRVELFANRSIAQRLLREHQVIYEAIFAGNEGLAGRRMAQHLRHVERMVMKYL